MKFEFKKPNIQLPNIRRTSVQHELTEEEVKLIEKFPEFAKMCSDALTDVTKAMDEVIEHTDKNTHKVLDAYLSEINTLQDELKREDLSLEDKLILNDEIKELLIKYQLIRG